MPARAVIVFSIDKHKPAQKNITKIIDDLPTTTKIKNILKTYAGCNHIHSNLKLTFAEVLGPVLDYINHHENKPELIKILSEEIEASEGKCFQGRLSRLIGVLSGYHPMVNINISDNEQLGNVVIMLKQKYKNINVDKFIIIFKEELQERGYNNDIIEEWCIYIKDNY